MCLLDCACEEVQVKLTIHRIFTDYRTMNQFLFIFNIIFNNNGWHDPKQVLSLAFITTLVFAWEHHLCTKLFLRFKTDVISIGSWYNFKIYFFVCDIMEV